MSWLWLVSLLVCRICHNAFWSTLIGGKSDWLKIGLSDPFASTIHKSEILLFTRLWSAKVISHVPPFCAGGWLLQFVLWWNSFIEANEREIYTVLTTQFLHTTVKAKHAAHRESCTQQTFLLFCLCTENPPVQTSKSKTNNIICLCPFCIQLMKSSQSALLIIMIITLSLLV